MEEVATWVGLTQAPRTATPERGDGVAQQFFDGRTASELRLWDALDADLLVPFHYFGVSDDVDLSQLEWKRGNYDTAQLNNLYTGNDARAAKVIRELRDKVTSTEQMRAIDFCVSVQHAHDMVTTRLGGARWESGGRATTRKPWSVRMVHAPTAVRLVCGF